MVVCREKVLCSSKHDSHRRLLDEAEISTNSTEPDFVKVELVPQDNKFEDLDSYTFQIDQTYLPEWWSAEFAESECREILKRIMKNYPVEFPGDLKIQTDTKLPKLESVGGYVAIWSNSKLIVPKLKSVGGYVYILGKVELPKLETVGGDVIFCNDARFEAPLLKTVGRCVYIWGSSKLIAPNLKTVGGGVSVGVNTKLVAPLLKPVDWLGYLRKIIWHLTCRRVLIG